MRLSSDWVRTPTGDSWYISLLKLIGLSSPGVSLALPMLIDMSGELSWLEYAAASSLAISSSLSSGDGDTAAGGSGSSSSSKISTSLGPGTSRHRGFLILGCRMHRQRWVVCKSLSPIYNPTIVYRRLAQEPGLDLCSELVSRCLECKADGLSMVSNSLKLSCRSLNRASFKPVCC